MSLTLIKFSSHECGLCARMAFFDEAVAKEFGLLFRECYPESEDPSAFSRIFDEFVASDELLGWPTYVLAEQDLTNGALSAISKYQGGVPKAKFREVVSRLLGNRSL